MDTFIQQLARHIHENYGQATQDLCVVMPGRRAHLYLRRDLAMLSQQAQWAPGMLSAEDFVFSALQVNRADILDQLFMLYEIYQQQCAGKVQSFDEFLSWGQVILSDFNEIDLYLADAGELFNYISQAKAIAMWNPGETTLTPFQHDYLQFYRSLRAIYNEFVNRLSLKNEAYQGMAFRRLAARISEPGFVLPWKKIIFAGFNALTPSEEVIIKELEKQGIATVLWDADSYYLNDKDQEAGVFLRQYRKEYPEGGFKWISDGIASNPKQINIYGIAGNIGQVKMMGKILQETIKNQGIDSINRTVLVLPDEKLLLPALQSVPAEIEKFNVTMGLPLSSSPAGILADMIAAMFESREGHPGQVHVISLIALLQHTYMLKVVSGDHAEVLSKAVSNVLSSGRVYMTPHMVKETFFADNQKGYEIIEGLLLADVASLNTICQCIARIIEGVRSNFTATIHTEYLYALAMVIARIRILSEGYHFTISSRASRKILNKLLSATTLPFYGEPLQGLQIMGMLETRTLDFETVFLLSANDDNLPSSGRSASFIPYDIRIEGAFNLPVFRHKTAVFAYHFYHLLHRSSNLHIFYNTESGDLGGGEMSRFVIQLMQELPAVTKNVTINHRIVSEHPSTEPFKNWSFDKTTLVIDKLKAKALSGFSPSSIATYILCPLKFYMQQILGITEQVDTSAEIDPARFGSVIHEALSNAYGKTRPLMVTEIILKDALANAEELVRNAFLNVLKGADIVAGNNKLMFEVAVKIFRSFIEHEIRLLVDEKQQIRLLALEQDFIAALEIPELQIADKVVIKGRFDRVDENNGITRIIDYKTGKFDKRGLSGNQGWETLLTDSSLSKVFQLLAYTWIYLQNNPGLQPVAGIYSLRNISEGFITHTMPGTFNEQMQNFEVILKEVIKNIFDTSVPFNQTDNVKNCIWCDFKGFCGRY